MKFILFSSVITFSALSVSPVDGQGFGLANRKKQAGASFQELNEQAKKGVAGAGAGAGAGGMGDMDALMKQMGVDPEALKQMMGDSGMMDELANMGPQIDEVMKMMADMSPEDLAKQMEDAMDMFGGDDMMANMVGHRDEILKTLEDSGAVDAEELERFRRDPEYFEQKMKESMDQMKDLIADPELMATAAQGMKMAQDMQNDPNAMNDMMAEMMKDLSDEDIESVRQMFIGGDGGDPMIKELLGAVDTAELEDVLQDPVKWRKTVKDGLGLLGGEGAAGQAGGNRIVGEL